MLRLRHIKIIGCLAALSSICFVSSVMAGTIEGSAHDFGGQYGEDQICIFCHTPHNANTAVELAPLWNHFVDPTQEYTPYDSVTLDAVVGQPDGISLLCLSCHDGTIAVDSFGGSDAGTNLITGSANLTTVLSDDHPISFDYNDALADTDRGLHMPSSTTVTIGSDKQKTGTITEILLFDGKLQCASCHDVHNTYSDGEHLLKITISGSKLCLTCHDK